MYSYNYIQIDARNDPVPKLGLAWLGWNMFVNVIGYIICQQEQDISKLRCFGGLHEGRLVVGRFALDCSGRADHVRDAGDILTYVGQLSSSLTGCHIA